MANFLFSGVIFGWAPMQLLLEEDGVYQHVCTEPTLPCDERVSRLTLLYTIGSTAAVAACVPCGPLVDYFGPVICGFLSGLALTSGLALVGISDRSFDAFAPGYFLIGSGGVFLMLNSLSIAFVVPKQYMSFVLTGVNSLFDASSIVFLILYQLYKQTGIRRQTIFMSYAAVSLALHICFILAWVGKPLQRLYAVKDAEAKLGDAKLAMQTRESESQVAQTVDSSPDEVQCAASGKTAKESRHPRLHGLQLKKQLQSFEFLFALINLSLQLFRSNMYMGINKELLEDLGDDRYNYAYTQTFAISMMVSCLWFPLINRFLQSRGFGDAFLLVAALGIVWNVVALIPSLPAQLAAFAAFTNFRAFLYATHFTYVAHSFGSRTNARVHAVITCFASIANFMIWPCVKLVGDVAAGNLNYIIAPLLVLGLPPILFSLRLRRKLTGMPEADCKRKDVSLAADEAPEHEQAPNCTAISTIASI